MKEQNPLIIELPQEFNDLCERDGTDPETVIRGFIADLCGIRSSASHPREDGYSSNGRVAASRSIPPIQEWGWGADEAGVSYLLKCFACHPCCYLPR